MASKNSVKTYIENAYYHIYNRGVEKRIIFNDLLDYNVYLLYLKQYLSHRDDKIILDNLQKPGISWSEKSKLLRQLNMNNFSDEINLIAFCLMPNHFHFLVKQKHANSIDRFMNSLNTRYVMYFNKRHKRIGPLYQGVYKAVLINSDEQLLYLSSYIHRNPLGLLKSFDPEGDVVKCLTSQPSSILDYLNSGNNQWVHKRDILKYFSRKNPRLNYLKYILESNNLNSSLNNLYLDN